jgi:hypothetical protein
MQIEPFTLEHLQNLQCRSFEAREQQLAPLEVRHWQFLLEAGAAYTMLAAEGIIGCMGLFLLWPGVAEGWAYSTDLTPKYALSVHRAVKKGITRFMKAFNLRRLQIRVHVDNAVGRRWAERLGFSLESVMRQFGPDGGDYCSYVMLREERGGPYG